MKNKKNIMTIFAIALITGSLFVSQPVHAADGGFWGGNFFSGFITYIAQKFGLDKTKVQSAMQDYQKQTKATITPRPTMSPQQLQDAEKKRLDVFVSQGKITGDQENAIIAELTAMRIKYAFDKNMTPDPRKTQMTNMQTELKAWAQTNGISMAYLAPFGQARGFGEGRMNGDDFRGRGPRLTPKPTQ